jgi:hypothetical protein
LLNKKLKFKKFDKFKESGNLSYKFEEGKGKFKFLGSGVLYISSCSEAL